MRQPKLYKPRISNPSIPETYLKLLIIAGMVIACGACGLTPGACLTSIISALLRALFVFGSVPFSEIQRSIFAFSYTPPEGVTNGWAQVSPEMPHEKLAILKFKTDQFFQNWKSNFLPIFHSFLGCFKRFFCFILLKEILIHVDSFVTVLKKQTEIFKISLVGRYKWLRPHRYLLKW